MLTHRRPRRARTGGLVFALAALIALPLAGCDDPFGSGAGGSTPTLALASPAPGQVVVADSVVVEGTATDNRSVARVTRGEAVGMYLLSSRLDAAGQNRDVRRPFFWDGARSHDVIVADADWRVDGAVDVNDAGVILAHAANARTGQKGAVLLTPRN
jgi:hypothetical protein